MKRINLNKQTLIQSIVVFIFSFSFLALPFSFVSAQVETTSAEVVEDNGATVISPSVVDIPVGGNYELTIKNDSDLAKSYDIVPSLFILDLDTEKLTIYQEGTAEAAAFNFASLVTISEKTVSVEPRSEAKITITYLKTEAGYFPGVVIKEDSGSQDNVDLTAQLASIIVGYTLTQAEAPNFLNSLDVKPLMGFGNLSLDGKFKISTTIENKTDKILKPTGEIMVSKNNQRIDQILLTTTLPDRVLPTKKFVAENNSNIKIGFLNLVNVIKFEQNIKVNDILFTQTKTLYFVPIQTFVIAAILIVLIILMVIFWRKRKNKKQVAVAPFGTVAVNSQPTPQVPNPLLQSNGLLQPLPPQAPPKAQ